MQAKKMMLYGAGILMLASQAWAADSTGQYLDDAAITAKVKAALVADSTVHANDVTVTTEHGVVKLTGTVDTQQQYAMAAKDANSVSGVLSVSNMLTVHQAAEQ